MSLTIQQVLLKYWGYHSFRPFQAEIIQSVLDGHDTLALLPTGGGKSICFQVPAMLNEGVCVVISPLIALMKDQVEVLKKKGIKATAIYSGMHNHEIDIAFDNCIYGDTKFLYMSPERLGTDLAVERLKKMKVNLIAIDEAHCISQWGYDFRPPYLSIARIREYVPNAPIIALTATATSVVVEDIQAKLKFKNGQVFQQSFERKNLAYAVLYEEDKLNRLVKMFDKVQGSGIVYVRSRRKTKEIAEVLQRNSIRADYYHAGLPIKARSSKQDSWKNDNTRIMVTTNAFGMGIDKSNVRMVVHMDLPNSLEEYYQEAGRAGRDGQKSYAIVLYNDADVETLKQHTLSSYPTLEVIGRTYNALGNYYQVPVGSGRDMSFNFDMNLFCAQYNLNLLETFSSLKFLEKEGYIITTQALYNPSKVHVKVNKEELYRFQLAHKQFDGFIKVLLRSYTGIFNDFVHVNEELLATRLNSNAEEVTNYLLMLEKQNMIDFVKHGNQPRIVFCENRVSAESLHLSKETYEDRKKNSILREESVIHYVTALTKCRSRSLLDYFGEHDSARCGSCDVCTGRNKVGINQVEFDRILNIIKPLLQKQDYMLDELVDHIHGTAEDKVIKVIQWLLDNEKIMYDSSNYKLKWMGTIG